MVTRPCCGLYLSQDGIRDGTNWAHSDRYKSRQSNNTNTITDLNGKRIPVGPTPSPSYSSGPDPIMMLFRSPMAAHTLPRPPAPPSPPKSPPSVSQIIAKLRQPSSETVQLSSGQPQTHPHLAEEGACSAVRVAVEQIDRYVCTGDVDVPKLLRGSRSSLLAKARTLGATCMVDEWWRCTIRHCKSRQRQYDIFRVHIHYNASATRSDRPDANKPVALEQAQNHSGLMTILSRE